MCKFCASIATKAASLNAVPICSRFEKLQGQLYTLKTNKEYSAILVQISGEKAEVAKMETGLLEQMGQLEAVGKTIARLEARLGVRLFHRTTRSQRLTEEGQLYYER